MLKSSVEKAIAYIKENLRKGYTIEQLKEALINSGYTPSDINEAINIINQEQIVPPPPPVKIFPPFQSSKWTFKVKVGRGVYCYNESDQLVLFCKGKIGQPEWCVCSDEACLDKLLKIIVPLGKGLREFFTFKISDPKTGEEIGKIQRAPLLEAFKFKWTLLKEEKEIGVIEQTSQTAALGFILGGGYAQQVYHITVRDRLVARITEQQVAIFYTHAHQMEIYSPHAIDPRLLVAAGILISYVGRER